jgi:hypothetical protein
MVEGEIREKYIDGKIEGATVLIKGKSMFVKTDINGKFQIEVEDEEFLKILKKGYKGIEIKPDADKLSIELEKENVLL